MSIKQMAKVWEWSQAESTSLLVMLALADHADDDGYCFPGVARIAKKCRISDRSVQRHIKELQDAGELRVDAGKGVTVQGGATNRYRITVNNPEQLRTQRGDKLTGGDKLPPEGVTNGAQRGDTAMSPKSSGESSEEPSAGAPAREDSESSIESKVALPPELDSDEFLDAIELWISERRAKKIKAYTPLGFRKVLSELAGWGQARSIAAIHHSIKHGYQGIYEEKSNATQANQTGRNNGTFNSGTASKFAGREKLA